MTATRAATRVATGVTMALTLGVALGVAGAGLGCGGKAAPSASGEGGANRAPRAATGAGRAARRGKLPPRTQRPLAPMAKAFLDEAEKAEDDAACRQWIDDAKAAGQALESGNPALARGLAPPPPLVASAVRALEAWAASGEPVSIGEQSAQMSTLFPSFHLVTAFASVVERSDDPRAVAALRFAKALRAPDNAAIAIALGSGLAARWATVLLQTRRQPVTRELRDYAVTEADAMALGRALASESLALARMITFDDWKREAYANGAIPEADAPKPRGDGEPGSALDPSSFQEVVQYREQHGLSTKDDWVYEEFAAYDDFWNETESLVASAASPAEVVEIFEQRITMGLEHPTSMLVRLVGGMVMTSSAAQTVTSCLEDAQLYASLLAGAPRLTP